MSQKYFKNKDFATIVSAKNIKQEEKSRKKLCGGLGGWIKVFCLKSIKKWRWTVFSLANENWVISRELSSKHPEVSTKKLSAHFQARLSQLELPVWVCSKPIQVRKCFLLFTSLRSSSDADWKMSRCWNEVAWSSHHQALMFFSILFLAETTTLN